MLLCICVPGCVSANACELSNVFMKLHSILAIFIVILFMSCGEFPRGVYINLVKFKVDIQYIQYTN